MTSDASCPAYAQMANGALLILGSRIDLAWSDHLMYDSLVGTNGLETEHVIYPRLQN
jgi:hypothetical protein